MRKQAFLLVFSALLVSLSALANKVVVKGTIQTPNGAPVVGKTVWFSTTSNNTTTCAIKDSTRTNPNGYFIDTLQCTNADIRAVTVSFRNCEGLILSKTLEVPLSGVIEIKLADCLLANASCRATFAYERITNTGNTFRFVSTPSIAANGDSIVRRVWTFGDGSANEGNNAIVSKEYKNGGVYEVCLKIVTRSGCVSTTCQKVEVPMLPAACKAGFLFERIPTSAAGTFGVQFSSAPSTAAPGDEIVSRTWTFGDGSTLTGNEVKPVHTYKQAGLYEVCLTIKTAKGCESKWCGKLELRPTSCTPDILHEIIPTALTVVGTTLRFNSKYAPMAPDSIVSRTWIFGDGQTLSGNVPNPAHLYKQSGSYKVCLVTKTRLGCVSEVCKTINVVVAAPLKCEAQFKFERGPENIGYFSAAPTLIGADDAIVKTIWRFGDSSSMQTMEGLQAKHQYRQPGVYEVCLTVITRNGCESKTCRRVEIGPLNTSISKCEVRFTADASRPGLVVFNSEGSITSLPNDKIVYRRWDFGNGKVLEGNRAVTEMQYPFGGRFNVCLTIKTAQGCEARLCKVVEVKQGQAPMDSSRVWLVRYYPNPVQQQLFAIVYAPKENEEVELAVVDVYGLVKYTRKVKVPKGYSTHLINTGALLPGPYVLRVRSAYGVQTRSFFKVN